MAFTLSKLIRSVLQSTSAFGNRNQRFQTVNMPSGRLQLGSGTGATQINVGFVKSFTIAAGANLDIDFTSGQTTMDGIAVVMTKVKTVYVEITTPGTADSLRVGPQGVTNGWAGWWQANTTNFWDECRGILFQGGPNFVGWAVSGSSKVLRLNNPGAASVSGYIEVTGLS